LTRKRKRTLAEYPPFPYLACMSFTGGSVKDRLSAYAQTRGIQLTARLGFGKDGSVWATSRSTAVKVFEQPHAYEAEQAVYERLQSEGVSQVLGHRVPNMLQTDSQLGIIEMTIVEAPFLLDFAGAHLDFPQEFPEEVMQEWLASKQEEFGPNWGHAAMILIALERMGIYMLDVHPGNIRFQDPP